MTNQGRLVLLASSQYAAYHTFSCRHFSVSRVSNVSCSTCGDLECWVCALGFHSPSAEQAE